MKNAFYLFVVVCMLTSCSGNSNTDNTKKSAGAAGPVPQERTNANPKPVATFSENITGEMGKLNHWKFAVELYETKKTFTYRLQIQYAELNITDSLQFPDLGFAPKPALQKGKDDYSCIIGFFDNQNVFRDYKMVQVSDGDVRIHTLKRYGVQHNAVQ